MSKRFEGTTTKQRDAGNRVAAATPAGPKAATAATPSGPKATLATPATTSSGPSLSHAPMSLTATTNGMVSAYSVDADRLMIKLNVSAIRRMLISVSAASPQYRSAVSATMMAFHNKERIYIRYATPLISTSTTSSLEILQGSEVGVGEDALSFDDWPYNPLG
ncbi:MAG: hypothetical protein ABI647_15595 [Gemmatimonadota bacterium]